MNPPRSFKFRFKTNGMRAHCVRERFRNRSRPCFVACACDVHSTFKDLIVAERARPCSSGRRVIDCAVWARSGRIISVQNGEHTFCSKRRHNEEKSVNGHSPLPAKRGASSAEPPFFSDRLVYGEGISERNPAFRQHRRRSTSGRCCAAAERSPVADIVLELRSSYS